MNRRDFLQGVGAAGLTFSLTPNLQAGVSQAEVKTDKSVIFVFLGGGASIADTFNPKPDSLPEHRPVNGVVTTEAGYLFGADFPKLAKRAKSITTVHNFKTFDGNHSSASAYVYTGLPAFGLAEGSPAKNPSHGAYISYTHGERNPVNGLPHYIKIDKQLHDGSGWLGAKYMGFASDEDGIKNLKINVDNDTFIRRNQMVNEIERNNGRNDYFSKEWSNLRNSARDIVMGQAAQAFNLKNEDPKFLLAYGADKGGFGKSCLLARRMIEAGAKVVTLTHGGWDMHGNISMAMKERSVDLDTYLSVLIDDLKAKGLDKHTMIVVTSEFSRTKMNLNAGRDHNPNITPLLLIGGKYGGSVIGQSSKDALMADGIPFKPEDLSYTILHWLDVPSSYTIVRSDGRPMHLVANEAKLIL